MFPIRWNFPFRKKDGSMSTIGAEIAEGGGGGYTLPTASAETKGGVKIGSGLAMEGEVLNNSNPTPYSLPTASSEVLGGVKVGTGLTITEGVLSNDNPTPYSLPTASSEVLGGVKVGDSLKINNGVIDDKWEDFSSSITFTEGAALNAGGCWKRGKIILFNMRIEVSSTLQTTGNTIFTLPEGSRPSNNMYFPMVAYTTDNYMYPQAYASMNNSGNMNVNRNSFSDKGLARCWFNTIIILD